MVVYIEYVIIENFVLDCLLLYLSFRAARVCFAWKKLTFSALFGAGFALLFPLLPIGEMIGILLKIAVGFLLCLLPFLPIKRKNDWGRYALSCFFFFLFSFAFGGGIFALYNAFIPAGNGYLTATAPISLLVCAIVSFMLIAQAAIKKWYQKRTLFLHIYNCAIAYKQRRVAILGFYDSGNLATKNGVPVCFITPDIAYDLLHGEHDFLAYPSQNETDENQPHNAKYTGQVRDEIVISTLNGEKTLPLFKADLEIHVKNHIMHKKGVYFAISTHIISREYKLLLHSSLLDEND